MVPATPPSAAGRRPLRLRATLATFLLALMMGAGRAPGPGWGGAGR